ncbi:MAG: response regulator [Ignavibacteriaceae bacterium]|nr:response regulator [Ignavibacteriaceae bacterium]
MSKILVIEDDPSVRVGIIDLLTEEGYEVLTAENGKQGISQAKMYLPDLIISDILMPDVDGYTVFNELQKEVASGRIPFIFLSARADANDIRYGMNLGADDYLTKPYKANDLISAVNSKLSRKTFVDKKIESIHLNIAKSLPHELRTPLVSILGLSQLILDHDDQLDRKEIIEMVAKINKAGSNLNKIIEKFLFFSELEVMKSDKEYLLDFSAKSTHVNKDEIFLYVKPVVIENRRENDIDIHLEEAIINIMPDHFKVIIEELVNNACKFSRLGSRISINSYIENDIYVLEFKDHGVGMSNEQIEHVGVMQQFDRHKYFQNGLGMGLALVQKILSVYGGELSIKSEKDVYTTVQVLLKIKNN